MLSVASNQLLCTNYLSSIKGGYTYNLLGAALKLSGVVKKNRGVAVAKFQSESISARASRGLTVL